MNKRINKVLDTLVKYKYLLPLDIYERHKFIGSKISSGAAVLDVGGSLSQLDQFAEIKKLKTVDVKPPADIIYEGKRIPVTDNSYETITAIDVLEHIPKKDRPGFIAELVRVASRRIIISAPLGTREHLEYEKRVLKKYQKKGISLPYLDEHVKIGLPAPDEIEFFSQQYSGKEYYSGNIYLTEFLLAIHTFEVKNVYLNYLVFILKLAFNLLANFLIYPFLIGKNYSQKTNRFYLIINK